MERGTQIERQDPGRADRCHDFVWQEASTLVPPRCLWTRALNKVKLSKLFNNVFEDLLSYPAVI